MANEKRLIDANKVAQDVRENNRENFTRQDWSSKQVCALLENAPTVDAVEVVRCKDCKHWFGNWYMEGCTEWHGHCHNDDEPVGRWESDFCSYGERRTE